MQGHLNHHLEIAGTEEWLFSKEVAVAVQQGSVCLLRRLNFFDNVKWRIV